MPGAPEGMNRTGLKVKAQEASAKRLSRLSIFTERSCDSTAQREASFQTDPALLHVLKEGAPYSLYAFDFQKSTGHHVALEYSAIRSGDTGTDSVVSGSGPRFAQ
ncbi:hypothetical protein UY3_03920 [Chelonia mydas]|uniref:Uncharacterized protein n=1 Tax=Chelonia mydas TaxID=8469 RepID=M7BT08_CHEMY|nr:hypothetical protein UY3_03920 [Chelonia mydas]